MSITIIQFRRGTASAWVAVNPVLAGGEPGYETDTKKCKVGDGITPWNSLDYMSGSGALALQIIDNLTTSDATKALSANQGVVLLNQIVNKATLQTGALSASTTQAPNATAVQNAIATATAALVNAAPGALDTLKELADAMGDDANFAATMTAALAGKQPLDADLTAIATLSSAADHAPYATGVGTWALYTLTAFARSLAACADAAAVRGLLGLTSGAPATTAFTTIVPLDSYREMAPVELSALGTDLSLTVDGTTEVDYGECMVSLVADGAHDVLVDASVEMFGGQGYDNTDGRLQMLRFWRQDGRRFWANALGPILTAPTIVSAVLDPVDATIVRLTWSHAIDTDVSPATAFAITGKTISSHNWDDSLHSHLVVTAAFTGGSNATLAYTAPTTHKMRRKAAQFTRENTPNFSGSAVVDQDLDPFTYADTTIPALTPTGKAYSAYDGGAFAVTSNRLVITTGGGYVFDSLRSDGLFQCQLSETDAGMGGFPALVFRMIDANNHWRVLFDGANVYLDRFVAGVKVNVGSAALAHAAGTDYVYSAVCSGNTFQIFRDGVLITGFGTAGTVTDSANMTGTKVGVWGVAGKGCTFDNLRAAPPGTSLASGPVTLLADNYNRADGAVGTSSHGEVYAGDSEGTSPGLSVVSNQAQGPTPHSTGFAVLNSGHTAYTASVDVTHIGNDMPALLFRANTRWGNSAGSAHMRAELVGGNVRLVKNTDGVDTVLQTVADPGGVNLSVSLDASNNIAIKRGTTTVITANDASYATQTYVGLRTNYAGTPDYSTFDNFLVTNP